MKEIFACRPCAEQAELKLIRHKGDVKDTCQICGKRRYGDIYGYE